MTESSLTSLTLPHNYLRQCGIKNTFTCNLSVMSIFNHFIFINTYVERGQRKIISFLPNAIISVRKCGKTYAYNIHLYLMPFNTVL
jgi:hypothetical protein